MLTCFLVMTSQPQDKTKPCCYVTVAEDEFEAVDNIRKGYDDFLVLTEEARIAGTCDRAAASRMGVPMDRRGYVARASAHLG
jgi:hypothetical protein